DMQPTIESLRELKKKFIEIEAENTELNREKTVFLAKEAELIIRIIELEQSTKKMQRIQKAVEKQYCTEIKDGDNSFKNLLYKSNKDQFQDLSSENYNISSDILCNTEITNEQDSLFVFHIISTNNLYKLKKKKALIQEISFKKNYTNENLFSDWKKKPRFQNLSLNNNLLKMNSKNLNE
ncbi:22586_t:CDS:2, partial [Gigaspora rosea]